MPFLSIVIPVYNAEAYLEKCLASIRMQTFSDYEVLMIDDGSKDKSGLICDSFAQKDTRFISIHVPNGGPSRARNLGFKEAKGKYIYCIDNDDYISSDDYFDKIVSLCREGYPELIQTGATYYSASKEKVLRTNRNDQCVWEDDLQKPAQILHSLLYYGAYETSCWTKIIRTDFLRDNSLYFDESLTVEDLDWNMRIFQCLNRMRVLKTASYVHVFRQGSITAARGEKRLKNFNDQILVIYKWGHYFVFRSNHQKIDDIALAYLSYQFFITLGLLGTLEEKYRAQAKKDLRKCDFVVKYAIQPKHRILSMVYRVCGFELAERLTSYYYNNRRTRVR